MFAGTMTMKPYSKEQISNMTEEELQRTIGFLRRKIRETRRKKQDAYTYEVEFCYLVNEFDRRQNNQRDSRKVIEPRRVAMVNKQQHRNSN